jgi:uroporphyrinogen-III synthase
LKHQVDANEAIIACLGPTTAEEARRSGLRVDLIPDEYTSAGMVCALARHFQPRVVSA